MSAQPAPITTQTHSTGPRTEAGKATSSQNALTHGLASGTPFIYGESKAAYDALLAGLLSEWQPATPTETILVSSMAKHHWLVERALRLQADILHNNAPDALPDSFPVLIRYQTTNERAFARSLKSLQELQRARREFVSQNEAVTESKTETDRIEALLDRLTAPPTLPADGKITDRTATARTSPPQS